ncbi:MAG: hypothetical protein QOK03_1887, partial [Candidatus Binataceae bacterium]|nr:hypothetical protein [Candidatus Binataceae bacterium]
MRPFEPVGEASMDPSASPDFWRKVLTEGHRPIRF